MDCVISAETMGLPAREAQEAQEAGYVAGTGRFTYEDPYLKHVMVGSG